MFYEVGYAHAKGKLCILLTSRADHIPFDLKHQRHIVYGISIASVRRDLEKELAWARAELEKRHTSHIKVTLQNSGFAGLGNLERTQCHTTARIPFVFDLENRSSDRYINIHAMYFYTSSKWDLYQDDKLCASSAAAETLVDEFKPERRHFFEPPNSSSKKERGHR